MKKNVVIEILKIVICYQGAAINHPGQGPIIQFETRRVQTQPCMATWELGNLQIQCLQQQVKAE